MVSFSADNDRELRSIWLLGISKGFESFDHFRVFLIDDDTELPFRDTITVDDDSAWQHPLVFLVKLEAFHHHFLQIGDHLLRGQSHHPAFDWCRLLTSFLDS